MKTLREKLMVQKLNFMKSKIREEEFCIANKKHSVQKSTTLSAPSQVEILYDVYILNESVASA